jgi:hypothetical protein
VLHDKYMCPDPCSGSRSGRGWHYCAYWSCVSWATWQKAGHSALLHKGTPISNCTLGKCNPVNFTVLKTSDWEQGCKVGKDKWKGVRSQDPTAPQVSDYQQ